MGLGHLPMLKRGPLALMLGGNKILPDVKEAASDKAMAVVQITSALFQLCIFLYKKRISYTLTSYAMQLKKTVFDSMQNLYNVHTVIIGKRRISF